MTSVRGDGLPWLMVAHMSMPSSGCLLLAIEAPARSISVGYVSTTWMISSTTVPGLMWPGQFTKAGTRVPPS